MHFALQHKDYFKSTPLSAEEQKEFEELATKSLADTKALEDADNLPFDAYLDHYFAHLNGHTDKK